MKLTKNVGKTDRTIRLGVAGVLVVTGILVGQSILGVILSLIGLVVLFTGYIGFCPVYIPFKIDTNKDEDA